MTEAERDAYLAKMRSSERVYPAHEPEVSDAELMQTLLDRRHEDLEPFAEPDSQEGEGDA